MDGRMSLTASPDPLTPNPSLSAPVARWAASRKKIGREGCNKMQRLTFSTHSIVNEYRTARVAEVLSDFRTLQYYIAAAPVNPDDMEDYYTEGWAALRQCALDGQHILNCGADISVPSTSGGPDEQSKAELKQ